MRRVLGILVGAFVGLAVSYGPTAYYACRATPDNNLCGLGAMMVAAPIGVLIGGVVGGWLTRPKTRARR